MRKLSFATIVPLLAFVTLFGLAATTPTGRKVSSLSRTDQILLPSDTVLVTTGTVARASRNADLVTLLRSMHSLTNWPQGGLVFDVPTRLVFKGDSLTRGIVVPEWPTYLTNFFLTNVNALWVTNAGVGGETVAEMLSDYAVEISPLSPTAPERGILTIEGGINDWGSGATEGSSYANLSNYWRLARADGWLVVAMTVPRSQGGDTAGVNLMTTRLNSAIRRSSGLWDWLIDLDAMFPAWQSDRADGIHFSTNANFMIAEEWARQVLTCPQGKLTPAASRQAAGAYPEWASASNVTAKIMFTDDLVSRSSVQIGSGGNQAILWANNPAGGNVALIFRTQSGGALRTAGRWGHSTGLGIGAFAGNEPMGHLHFAGIGFGNPIEIYMSDNAAGEYRHRTAHYFAGAQPENSRTEFWICDGTATNNVKTMVLDGQGYVSALTGFKTGTSAGVTTNLNVLLAGGSTNQLQFKGGILTAVVPQ